MNLMFEKADELSSIKLNHCATENDVFMLDFSRSDPIHLLTVVRE